MTECKALWPFLILFFSRGLKFFCSDEQKLLFFLWKKMIFFSQCVENIAFTRYISEMTMTKHISLWALVCTAIWQGLDIYIIDLINFCEIFKSIFLRDFNVTWLIELNWVMLEGFLRFWKIVGVNFRDEEFLDDRNKLIFQKI